MMDSVNDAINAALSSDWEKAISTNEAILKEFKEDVETLNRLAYAYSQIDKFEKARKIYRKVLLIDRYNLIAKKNLEKIISLASSTKFKNIPRIKTKLSAGHFIEEPGKTKTITLINIAPVAILSRMRIGDPVVLNAKKHSIEVRDQNKIYLGALPDDLAFRLLRFLKAGNSYLSCIKNLQKKSISIFIREIERGKRLQGQPTFIPVNHNDVAVSTKEARKNIKIEEESINQEELDE